MKFLNLCLLIAALITFISCGDQDDQIGAILDCDKLTSRDEAKNIMSQANGVRMTDAEKIKENLIGEWGLIGMLPGWVGFETGQECIRLTINADSIKLEDLKSGNNSSSEWELRAIEVNSYTGFFIETNEDVWNNRMGMQIFSEDIMYGSGNVEDGNTFIYEKLK